MTTKTNQWSDYQKPMGKKGMGQTSTVNQALKNIFNSLSAISHDLDAHILQLIQVIHH
jgi:hypothetical protein